MTKELNKRALHEKCPYSEFFWSVFSRIRPEYEDLRSKSVLIRENTDQKNSEYGHFLRTGGLNETSICKLILLIYLNNFLLV